MTDIRELLRAADEVRAPDLWAEIRARAAETVTAPAPPRAPSLPRRRLVPAAAIVLAAVVAAVVTLSIPRPQSAQAIITQAIRDFEHAPPFRAEVVGRIPAALLPGDGEQAAGAYRYRVWYRGQDGWRLELLEDTVPFAGLGGPGSVQVWNGREYVVYNASRRTSSTGSALPEGFSPLGVLGWNPLALQAVKELEGPRVSREGPDCRDSQVFEDAQIAGRRARHVRCDAFELWIDAETGLMLKIEPTVIPDRLASVHGPILFGLGITVEITEIEYDPAFPPGTFTFTPPEGSSESPLADLTWTRTPARTSSPKSPASRTFS